MIDFTTVKSLTIPEGDVSKIADASGNVLWKKDTRVMVHVYEDVYATFEIRSDDTYGEFGSFYNDDWPSVDGEIIGHDNIILDFRKGTITVDTTTENSIDGDTYSSKGIRIYKQIDPYSVYFFETVQDEDQTFYKGIIRSYFVSVDLNNCLSDWISWYDPSEGEGLQDTMGAACDRDNILNWDDWGVTTDYLVFRRTNPDEIMVMIEVDYENELNDE